MQSGSLFEDFEKNHRETLFAAVRESPGVVLITDRNGVIEYVNSRFTEVTGYTPEEVVGKKPSILKSGIHPPEHYKKLWDTILAGKVWHQRTCNRKKTGELFWSLMSIAPVIDREKGITHFVQTGEDITQWTTLEDSLRESEERLRLITENTHDLIGEIDEEGRYLFVNGQFTHLLGYSKKELVGRSFLELLHPEDLKKVRDKFSAILGMIGIPLTETARMRRRDGSWIWVEAAAKSYLSPKHEVRIVSTARDITARLEYERRIEEVNRTQELLLEQSPTAIAYVKDRIIQWANPQYRKLFGVPGKEIEGLPSSVFFPDQESFRRFGERFYPAMERGETVDTEQMFRRSDGTYVLCRVIGNALYEGRPRDGAIWLFEDISEIKTAQKIRSQMQLRIRALYALSQIPHTDERKIMSFALERAIELTGSTIGYFHFVSDDETGKNIDLFLYADSVLPLCTTEATSHYPLGKAGIWADCIRTGRPAIHNDYPARTDRKGLPDGHIPLSRHLSVPIREGDKIVAIIGVGNKKEPYDEFDAQQLELFIGQAWQLLLKKRAQEEVRQREDLFRSITSSASEAIIVFDGSGKLTVWNEAASRILGYDPEDILGKKINQVIFCSKDRDLFHNEALSVVITGQGYPAGKTVETAMVRKDGSLVPVEFSLSAFRKQNAYWGLAVIRNVEERKKNEQLKEDIQRITSHDLKTPLTALLNIPELLLMDDNLSEEQRGMLDLVRESALRMLRTLNLSTNILKLESGTYILSPKEFDLSRIFAAVEKDLSGILKGKNLRFRYFDGEERDFPAGSILLRGEESLVYMMVENLMKNAAEASPPSKELLIAVKRSEGGLSLRFTNRGEVPREIRSTFFDKYVTMGKNEGTGLGTYSAKLVARLHGGNIRLDTSEEGKTSIEIFLPGKSAVNGF